MNTEANSHSPVRLLHHRRRGTDSMSEQRILIPPPCPITPRKESMPVRVPPFLYLILATCLTCGAIRPAVGSAVAPPLGPNAPPPGAPAAPGSIETMPLSPTAVRIYWFPPPGAVAGYRVYRDGRTVAEVGPEARSWDDSGLEPGRSYRYRVAAFATAGEAAAGEAVAGGSTPAAAPAPATVSEGALSAEVVERPEPAWPERLKTDVLV